MSLHDEPREMSPEEEREYAEQMAFEDYQASLAEEFHNRIEEAKKLVDSYPQDQNWHNANEFLTRYATGYSMEAK